MRFVCKVPMVNGTISGIIVSGAIVSVSAVLSSPARTTPQSQRFPPPSTAGALRPSTYLAATEHLIAAPCDPTPLGMWMCPRSALRRMRPDA